MAAATKNGTGFNTPAVVLGTLAVLIFVYALSLFVQGGFLKAQDILVQERTYGGDNTVAQAAEAEQQALLEQGLPIEDAKRLLVEQAANRSE